MNFKSSWKLAVFEGVRSLLTKIIEVLSQISNVNKVAKTRRSDRKYFSIYSQEAPDWRVALLIYMKWIGLCVQARNEYFVFAIHYFKENITANNDEGKTTQDKK